MAIDLSHDVDAEVPRIDVVASSADDVDPRDLAIDLIQHGLCVFDEQQRLRLFNRRFAEMYNLKPDQLWIGMTMRELVDQRYAAGTGPDMEPSAYAAWRDRIGVANQIADAEIVLRNGSVHAIHYEPTASNGWVTTFTDITERRRAESRIRYLAHFDTLTGLPSRALFFERLDAILARQRGIDRLTDHRPANAESNRLVALFDLDLDHFKDVNDALGHTAGDELLRQAAARIQACLGEDDLLARLGGDEFAIVLDGTAADEAEIDDIARRVIHAVSEPFRFESKELMIGASIGIALCRRDDDNADPATLLHQADVALFRAKERQRGSACVFKPGMDAAIIRRKQMERDLRRAITDGGIEIHFQPLWALHPRRLSGVEALARWRHPQHGTISPAEFIPLAEDTGLIDMLGTWVLRRACAQAAAWDGITLAVNLSPEQVRKQNMVDIVRATLLETGLPPHRLELEITEGMLLRDSAATIAKLNQLRSLGVGIVLDDFGTGYSSLSYLRRYPFTKIKIDQSFVSAMTTEPGTAAIVRAIASLADCLDMQVLAEGIETDEQLEMICALGCHEGQGYLLGRPGPASAIASLLTADAMAALPPSTQRLRRGGRFRLEVPRTHP